MGIYDDNALEKCLNEAEMSISERLDPAPKHDAGHYVELPLVRNERTLEVAEGASCEKVIVLGGETSALTELPFGNVIVGAGAKLNLVILVLPGISVDLPLAIDLIGEGSDVNVSGLYLCGSEEKVQIRAEVRHRVPSCTSYQLFNGIAAGSSKVKFYGKIIVAPDAQKTEAYQTNHNLIVSSGAKAEAKPQLEIYADDVKCSHGATVGQLNEDEQFYMRSRGIPEDEARVLQMISFIAPVLAKVEDENRREELQATVEAAIRKSLLGV